MIFTLLPGTRGQVPEGGSTEYYQRIKQELQELADPEKAAILRKYFKALPGGYGEGDRFLGIKVPEQRKMARKYYREISLEETEKLLQDLFHECRLTALFIFCLRFEKGSPEERKELVNLYLQNLSRVNNWDLVDASAEKILGSYLLEKEKDLLDELAGSGDLWKERVAIMTTFHFIKQGRFEETLALVERFLGHQHDLIHKAAGWMLREVGKRDYAAEYDFLREHYRQMPRTMLRYAIEKFEPRVREQFLKGRI